MSFDENEVTEVTENEQEVQEEEVQEEIERQQELERQEQERIEAERQEAEERAREQARIEHENFLKSFAETTVFYDRIIEKDDVKWLGQYVKDAYVADRFGWLDNHYDESELTLIGNIYYLKGYEKPEESLDELKEKKLAEVSQIADRFEENKCPEMYFTSSLGFRVNGDRRSVQNIDNLITLNKPTRFKDYDNVFHPPFGVEPNFSVENLKILEQEIAQNGEDLYTQKFLYEYRIRNATSKEDLDFDIVFEMSDFSKN